MKSSRYHILLPHTYLTSSARDSTTQDQKRKERAGRISQMKAQLHDLLSRPVVARGISMKYITSGMQARQCLQLSTLLQATDL